MQENKMAPEATLKILVVDDVKENRRIFELILGGLKKDLGFSIEVACTDSGESAMQIHSTKPQDLILCDERLGGMHGTQFFKEFKKSLLPNQWVPFVIVSSKTTPKDWKEFYDSGVADFLPKPVGPEKLRFLIRSAFEVKMMRKQISVCSCKGEWVK